jgi:hypothetical protein
MPEETGCQTWGIMGRVIMGAEVTDKELDVLKRRLFAFGDIMFKHNITITDVREITDPEELRFTFNEFTREELERMFY